DKARCAVCVLPPRPFSLPLCVPIFRIFDALDGHDALILLDPENGHAAGAASLDAHACHRHADDLALIADQHQVVALFHRERSHDGVVLPAHVEGYDARTAASGDAIFVGTGALAETAFGDGEHELFARAQLRITLGRERCFLAAVIGIVGHLFD